MDSFSGKLMFAWREATCMWGIKLRLPTAGISPENETLCRDVDFSVQLFAVLVSLSAAGQIHVHISIIKSLCLVF